MYRELNRIIVMRHLTIASNKYMKSLLTARLCDFLWWVMKMSNLRQMALLQNYVIGSFRLVFSWHHSIGIELICLCSSKNAKLNEHVDGCCLLKRERARIWQRSFHCFLLITSYIWCTTCSFSFRFFLSSIFI